MEFSLTEEQTELYDDIVSFAQNQLNVPDSEQNEFFKKFWLLCAQKGITSMMAPQSMDGLELSAMDACLVMEALGYGCRDMGLIFSLGAHIFACMTPIIIFGGDTLKKRFLPGMGSGELVAAHCMSEPDAGSDAFGIKTNAQWKDDMYLLNGAKCYASNAPCADLFIVQAVTNPKAGFMGISSFVVEKSTKGLFVSNPYKKIGLETAPMGDVFFENCRIPIENRIGGEGGGGMVFTHSMNWERACLFAAYVGSMRRQMEETIAFTKSRKQFGKSIKAFQAMTHKIAEMKVRYEASRLLTYQAAWRLDQPGPPLMSMESAIAKLFVSEATVQSSLDAMQIHGALGLMREGSVERYLRDSVPSKIFSGTSEIQKNTIAHAIGLS